MDYMNATTEELRRFVIDCGVSSFGAKQMTRDQLILLVLQILEENG